MLKMHFVCKHGDNFLHLGNGLFESGWWAVGDQHCRYIDANSGYIYLHEKQAGKSWHGGLILSWVSDPLNPKRKKFTYKVDGDTRVSCKGKWGREKAYEYQE